MMAGNTAFAQKKANILESLSKPEEDYTDASPKGSIDAPIRELLDEINNYNGLVTTSSCSGRVSVFLEGSGRTAKGSGGKWLFVSHDPPGEPSANETTCENGPESSTWHEAFRLSADTSEVRGSHPSVQREPPRYIHLKFEPLILHILAAGAAEASKLLSCAQQAGFRESGASNIPVSNNDGSMINVAVRSTGLAFDNIIGYAKQTSSEQEQCISLVSEEHLAMLVTISRDKFATNTERINRFQALLRESFGPSRPGSDTQAGWEDATERKERKRAEGLRRQQELKKEAGLV